MISAMILAADVECGPGREAFPYGRCTIVEQVVSNILDSKVDEVILVLGSQATKIEKKVEGKPVKIIINASPEKGLSSSIKVGLEVVDNRASAVLIVLGDQPLIKGKVIDEIIAQYRESMKGIVVPAHKGFRGHPVLLSIEYRGELMNLSGNIGAREIVQRHKEDLLEVEVDTASIITDIEVDTDYLMQMRRFSILDKE